MIPVRRSRGTRERRKRVRRSRGPRDPSHTFPAYPRIVDWYAVTCHAPPLSSGDERSAVAGVLTFALDDRGQDPYSLCAELS